jgi:hypothetical protein
MNRDATWEAALFLSKQDAQAFEAECEILQGWIHPDPDRRVYTAIRSAFIKKFAHYYVLLNRMTKVGTGSPKTLDQLDKDWTLLAGLLFSRTNLWAAQDWRKPPILKFLLRELRRARKGRPATKQQVALRAKEMRLSDPKRWKWHKITSELCDCGKEHTIKCQDNIRRQVLHLEKTLRKVGCRL